MAVDAAGDLFIADYDNSRIREVNAEHGDITTVAGNGTAGYSGDGGPATAAELYYPLGVAVDATAICSSPTATTARIREVYAGSQVITTVVGDGYYGYSGDGGPAAEAELDEPYGVALDSSGNLFIADTGNYRVREAGGPTINVAAGDRSP